MTLRIFNHEYIFNHPFMTYPYLSHGAPYLLPLVKNKLGLYHYSLRLNQIKSWILSKPHQANLPQVVSEKYQLWQCYTRSISCLPLTNIILFLLIFVQNNYSPKLRFDQLLCQITISSSPRFIASLRLRAQWHRQKVSSYDC